MSEGSGVRTSRPFDAQFRSACGGGDDIEEDERIVMYAGEAWHVECAEGDGAVIPDEDAPARRPVTRSEDPYG